MNELATTRQPHMALQKNFQALTIESINEGGATFIVKPFKGDKKESWLLVNPNTTQVIPTRKSATWSQNYVRSLRKPRSLMCVIVTNAKMDRKCEP